MFCLGCGDDLTSTHTSTPKERRSPSTAPSLASPAPKEHILTAWIALITKVLGHRGVFLQDQVNPGEMCFRESDR